MVKSTMYVQITSATAVPTVAAGSSSAEQQQEQHKKQQTNQA